MALTGRDSSRYERFTRRAILLGGAQVAAFGVLGARMYYLQVVKGEEYRTLAEENRINVRLLVPTRGRIVDRFGQVLASNRQNYKVVLIPDQTMDLEETLDRLSQIVPMSEYDRKRIRRDVSRSPSFVPVNVAENLTWEQFARVNVHEPDLPGLQPEVGETRFYPHSDKLAHLVGYVGSVSEKELQDDQPLARLPGMKVGKFGIERAFDKDLRGSAGSSRVEVNAYGRVIRELARDDGKPGSELVLTLDMALQEYAWRRLGKEAGAAVVMNIHTGDLLSLVSTPAFDPNAFSVGLSQSEWEKLRTSDLSPMINKAVAGQYPPGSTVKMLVALAGLESGVIDANEHVRCNGRYSYGNHEFHCWKRGGHGPVNLHTAIRGSCDVYFYEVAKRVGMEKLAEVSHRFGLGETFDFGLPSEKAGLVPDPEWKQRTTGKIWLPGETLIAGIGQGYMLATPLQLAVMAARIGNGGRAVEPRLVRAVGGERMPVAEAPVMELDAAHLAPIRAAMDAVVNSRSGTAYGARLPDPDIQMAGKTGTSQVRRISKSERRTGVISNSRLQRKLRDHALFVAYAPIEAPQYAVSVIVEHGSSGSGTAAPIARDIMMETLKRRPTSLEAYLGDDLLLPGTDGDPA